MLKLTARSSWLEFRDAIESGQEFKTSGALRGTPRKPEPMAALTHGQLPLDQHETVERADYVVYSYATPIAWRTQGQWHTPDVRYSVTTSRHQSKINTAIAELLR